MKSDFAALVKSPEKYVEFIVEDKHYPNANGLYELRPFYQKINLPDQQPNYII
jgi:hypothetical protein